MDIYLFLCRSAGIGSVLLAVVLTLILWFFPRESVNGDVEIDIKVGP